MSENRIYISCAITGTDDYMERFAKAEKELTEQGYFSGQSCKGQRTVAGRYRL